MTGEILCMKLVIIYYNKINLLILYSVYEYIKKMNK